MELAVLEPAEVGLAAVEANTLGQATVVTEEAMQVIGMVLADTEVAAVDTEEAIMSALEEPAAVVPATEVTEEAMLVIGVVPADTEVAAAATGVAIILAVKVATALESALAQFQTTVRALP